jgi:A/G-specific adenine glycosylase
MLQQTRVDTVIPYYERFLKALPTVAALAETREADVLALWSGLGYYRRARMLHAAAREVVAAHRGAIPSNAADLRRLPGIGAYTAGAVASIAFGRREPVVDGNVERVISRLCAIEDDVRRKVGKTHIWSVARDLLADERSDPGDWNQALMELGATICLPRSPGCGVCPVAGACRARARGIAERLPTTGPKPRLSAVKLTSIVLASSKCVLLARRRKDLLFGGLWEPPCAKTLDILAAGLRVDPIHLREAGTIVHILSHRKLEVRVVLGRLSRRTRFALPSSEYDAVDAVPIARLDTLAHATLARKILVVANVGLGGLR